MDQELQDIIDHMDLSEEDSRELLCRFLHRYFLKAQMISRGPVDPDLDILCGRLVRHDSIVKVVEREFYELDLDHAYIHDPEVIGICSIFETNDGAVTTDVSDPDTKPYFLMQITNRASNTGSLSHNIVTDGDVWYGAAMVGPGNYRLQYCSDKLSQSDRKVIIQAIEEYVNGQEES